MSIPTEVEHMFHLPRNRSAEPGSGRWEPVSSIVAQGRRDRERPDQAPIGPATCDRGGMNAAIWWRWWAIAALAHVLGAPSAAGMVGRGLANIVVGWLAIAVIVRPDHRLVRTALAGAIVASAVVEAPLIGNHWMLAAAISAAALLARPWRADPGFLERFAPTARVILLVFYSFAAFAKLNSGFLDPVESCARFFANQGLSFWRLPEVTGDGPIAPALPWIALVVELSVPVLLVMRRTRRLGVVVAVVFHLLLTLDLRQHFYDFTLVLVPLFALFAPASFLAAIDRALPRLRLGGGWLWIGLFGAQVVAFHLSLPQPARRIAVAVAWTTWLALAGVIGRGLLAARRAERPETTEPIAFRPANLAGIALVTIVVLNGLSPYLELKTATGFNMYANLATADGTSNHLIVSRTAGLRRDQASTVEILSSDDDGLAAYADTGFALPVVNLQDYLADHPDVSVEYRLDGSVVEHRPDRAGPLAPSAMGWAVERFALFRAVPLADPPACQNVWLPAR